MAVVTSKGQVTLPKSVRDALGIEPGTEVDFAVEEGRAIILKRVPVERLSEWEGRLRGKLVAESVDETLDVMRGGRVDDVTK